MILINKYLVETKKVKIIKMEVQRNIEPKNNLAVRKLSNKHNVILILMNALLDLEKLMVDYIRNIKLILIWLYSEKLLEMVIQ